MIILISAEREPAAWSMLCFGPRAFCRAPAAPFPSCWEAVMSLGTILIIILIIILLGGYSGRFGGYGFGLGHSGMGLGGVILVVLLILVLAGKL